MPLQAVRVECKGFVLPVLVGPYFKPHSALHMNHYHGLWADEDASGEDGNNDELCL